MARARNIKPGLAANAELAECSIWARYLFALLPTIADREGRLEDRPKQIKGELLRFDSQDAESLLDELAEHRFIIRYRNPEGRWIQITKFWKHQTPHYSEKRSVIKPPTLQEWPAHERAHNHGNCSDEGNLPPGELRENSGEIRDDSKIRVPIKGGVQPPDLLIPDLLIPDSKTFAPDASRRGPKVNGSRVSFDPLKGAFQGITEDDELRWQDAYPAVPIPPAIAQAAAWLKANPANRKSNNERFLVNWFKREQDKAGRVQQVGRR